MSQNIELQDVQLQGLLKEYELISGIADLVNGKILLGRSPELVAKAVRDGFAIPLKYTQSFQSLSAVYAWAVQNGDTEMIQWATNQIISVLGLKTMVEIREGVKKVGKAPRLQKTVRQDFVDVYAHMHGGELDMFIQQMPDGFWKRQLNRMAKANQTRCQLTGASFPTCDLQPLSATLQVAFQKQDFGAKPAEIIDQAKVSGFVVAPALVEAHRARMYWAGILRNPCLTKGIAMFKKTVVPADVLEKLLQMSGAPESVLDEARKKFG